jgi:hypothetical protein
MRIPLVRLATLLAGITLILSCDSGPTVNRFGGGIAGGPSNTPVLPPPPGTPDTGTPFVRIDTPATGQLINIGDSILVVVRAIDDRKIGTLEITGFKLVGDPNLGTLQQVVRYGQVSAPGAQPFRPGLTDTIIRRYLQPTVPVDTTVDSLIIQAVLIDSAGNRDTARVRVNLVTGPRVNIITPTPNDSFPRGFGMSVAVHTTHPDGVASVAIRIQGEPTWPTLLDTTINVTHPAGSRDVTDTGSVIIPANAPLRGRITITANAVDVNRNPGSATPVTVFVRAAGTLAPRVTQIVPPRIEFTDSITVSASGDGITAVGVIVKDSVGNVLSRDSVTFNAPFSSNRVQKVPVGLALVHQGQRINVISFAWDNNAPQRIGYSMPSSSSAPVSVEANASVDTSLVAYGRTFALPRNGIAGDLAVDLVRGNVFISNTQFNLLEVWNNSAKTFAAGGIAVGALPWGLFVSNNPDVLLVGNSGATTISRVCINPGACPGGAIAEDLAARIRTRETVVFQIQFIIDPASGKIRLIRLPDIAYSDRPQYVAQSDGGRVFYSTRPTQSAEPGTLRWLDPALPFPDPRQIHSYGRPIPGATQVQYAIFHADSIRIGATPPSSPRSDTLYIWDHPYGQIGPVIVGIDSIPLTAVAQVNAQGADVEALLNFDVGSLALTDTTFVAASGDRKWIGFGEGNTAGTGRIMMVNDPAPLPMPGFFSPAITVTDIVHNASEKVFGISLDSTGLQATVHGLQTYVAALDQPWHLRLDGLYDSFDNGAGVAYHPRAKSTLSANADRVLFTATQSGVIEIVDVAHYNNRGRLTTKGNFYGPLRATGPLPGDPPEVILKLYGLSDGGLVVIDLRAADIKPGP